ncbi:hypothetical protein ACFWOT_18340 [Streptomyces sp. NPDC058440]|uniref:hypothetical protein n=1 Tax=Streptomyces sp. NPDC058440 TaxID=3346501 RepID=UPI003660723F
MDQEPDEDIVWNTGRQMAAVCEHLERIRADLQAGPIGDDAPVERVLAAARTKADLVGPLGELDALLQLSGDSQGLSAYSGLGGSRDVRAAGVSRRLTEPVYLCPAERCIRHSWPKAAEAVPNCAITGTALRRDRV